MESRTRKRSDCVRAGRSSSLKDRSWSLGKCRAWAPSISWEPECSVHRLIVTTSDFSTEVWELVATVPNGLRTPIQFGVVPQSADEVTEAQTLQGGTTYRIVLTVKNEESGNEQNAGTVTFTPF